MKNIQWSLITIAIIVGSFLFYLGSYYASSGPSRGLGDGIFVSIVLVLCVFFGIPIIVATEAKQRRGFHAFLTFTLLFLALYLEAYITHLLFPNFSY